MSTETHSLQDGSSDLPGFPQSLYLTSQSREWTFQTYLLPRGPGETAPSSMWAGGSGRACEGPQAAPPVPTWSLRSLGCWLAH